MRFIHWSVAVTLVSALCFAAPATARTDDYVLVLKNHRFEPAELTVPANTRIKLTIDNQDATPEEFDSHDLRVEKVLTGRSKGSVWVGPLSPGEYKFMGEFHEATAQGKLIAK